MDTAGSGAWFWRVDFNHPVFLGLAGLTAPLIRCASISDIRLRVSQAARALTFIDNQTAILPHPVSVAGYDLASLLMGMGIDVLRRPQALSAEFSPVFFVDAAGLDRTGMRRCLEEISRLHPKNVICAVTGTLTPITMANNDLVACFDDARACLQAAGFGFISVTEFCHAAKA
ncbi:MAG: hypothetical protein IBX58_18360 [Roseovarius sp.]|nr:hypothetical protein [Roseovarius sp.]